MEMNAKHCSLCPRAFEKIDNIISSFFSMYISKIKKIFKVTYHVIKIVNT